jgi:hypothetical protein
MKVENIRDTLKQVMLRLEEKKKRVSSDDFSAFLKKTLTKKELKHIKIHYFKAGVLHLLVDSSVWLYHFSVKKDSLLTQLRAATKVIQDIRFHLGEVR